MEIPDVIDCVDCGQKAHRLTEPPEEGWEAGDIVAFRCSGCNDRWDLVIDDPDADGGNAGPEFDFRSWLEDRNSPGENSD